MAIPNPKLFYALGPNCWGMAPTMEQAIAEAKKNWPSHIKPRRPQAKHFSVWATDAPKIYISQVNGSFTYEDGYSAEKIQTSTLARKDGE